MKTWYFVAGEQVMAVNAVTVLDAWLIITNRAKRGVPIASEYRTLPIEAYSMDGIIVGRRCWQQWCDELLRDTYGDNYREILNHAQRLV